MFFSSITTILLVELASKVCASGQLRTTTYCITADRKPLCPSDGSAPILGSFSIDSGWVIDSKILPVLKPKWRDNFDLTSVGNLIFAADYCVYRNEMGHDNLVGCAQDCYPVTGDYINNPWHERLYGGSTPNWSHMKSGQTNRYMPTINDVCADPQVPPSSVRSEINNGNNVASNNIEPMAEKLDETNAPSTPADTTNQYLQQANNGYEIPVASLDSTTTVPNVPGRLDFASGTSAPGDFSVSENPTTYDVPGNSFSTPNTKDVSSGNLALLDTSNEVTPDWENTFTSKRAMKNARDFRRRAFETENQR